MLSQLFITNIAVIKKISIDFKSGFSVLTGETGAGKSILIDSINAVLGERTSRDLIRNGAESATISALFSTVPTDSLNKLTEFGLPLEDDDILLFREIRSNGKSVFKVNGAPATAAMVRDLSTSLITIHGQHENYGLFSSDMHLEYIDVFGDLGHLLFEYLSEYKALRSSQNRLQVLNRDEGEKARKLDLLRYQIEDIESAELQLGEQKDLMDKRTAIRNFELLSAAISHTQNCIAGSEIQNGVLADLELALAKIESISDYPAAFDIAQKLSEAKFLVEEVDDMLREFPLEEQSLSLDQIEERLDTIYKLGLKYGNSEEKILAFLDTCKAELHHIEFADEERTKLEAIYDDKKASSIELAKSLSQIRGKIAIDFSKQINSTLHFLNMGNICFSVRQERVPLNTSGCDRIEFMISSGIDSPEKPIAKVASGGELSRIMLAIKTVLANKDKVQTLIFDEVDAGISGEAANKVALKLKDVSVSRQVICITHLPQIASLADTHYLIQKEESDGAASTGVKVLDFEARKNEIARIIGGDTVSDLKLKMAEEMLNKS